MWYMSAGHTCLCQTCIFISSVCSFISNKIHVKQAEEENNSRQQERTQYNVDGRLQDVTKALQDNENVSIWIESIVLFVYKYSEYIIKTPSCFSWLEY